jgi:folate-binding protein YgfZ
MKPEWKKFLIECGAEFAENGVDNPGDKLISFGNPELERRIPPQGAVLSNLSDRGLIEVHGQDAESFLQNQLTNDIRNVTETSHQASAWCNPKGRIIANFRIFKRRDSYFLAVSADLLEHVIKKLRMYVMMSKVTIEDATESLIHFGFAGELAEEELQEVLDLDCKKDQAACQPVPKQTDQTLQYKTLSILRLPGTVPRFEVFGELDDARKLWEHCNVKAAPVSSNGWHYLNILAGLPVITEASSEAWIPQMVNYIAIGGVDFKKGCYPGQEVVARLNYLGKTKRRMYHIQINTDQLPAANDAIASDSDDNAGKILNAVINPEGKIEALAVLKISEADKQLALAHNNEATVSLRDLPYPTDDK